MTPYQFIAKWRASELKERSAAQEHFIDLCRLLDEPTPAEVDPIGDHYCFERGARKEYRRRRLGRRLEAPSLRLGVQGQARQPGRRVHTAPAICAGAGEPAAANRLGHAAVPHPHQLDQQRQPGPRVRTGRSRRRGRARQAQVGALGPGAPTARRNAAGAHRKSRNSLRVARAGTAGARPRSAGGGAFRQPARVLHVRRGRWPAAQRHVHADAGARAAPAGSEFVDLARDPVRRDGHGRPGRL